MNALTKPCIALSCSFLNLMYSSLSFITVIHFHKISKQMPMKRMGKLMIKISRTNKRTQVIICSYINHWFTEWPWWAVHNSGISNGDLFHLMCLLFNCTARQSYLNDHRVNTTSKKSMNLESCNNYTHKKLINNLCMDSTRKSIYNIA